MGDVLLTGASGALGRMLARELGAAGVAPRLTDIAGFPDALPPGARFEAADPEDGMSVLRLAEGCRAILHFGGVSVEQPFETVIGLRRVWSVGDNPDRWWEGDDRDAIGWRARDSAGPFRAQLAAKLGSDPVAERCQGGASCSHGHSRRG